MSEEIKHPTMASLNRDELFVIKQILRSSKENPDLMALTRHYQTKKELYDNLVNEAFLTLIKPIAKHLNVKLSEISWRELKKNNRTKRVELCNNKLIACKEAIAEIEKDGFRAVVEIAFTMFIWYQDAPEYGSEELRKQIENAKHRRPWLKDDIAKAEKGENDFEKLSFLFLGAACEGL